MLADNVVAASQPLAARAGIAMLEQGGNAVDAAIAAAAALTVVEPVMNGLGGDAQVLLWDGADVVGLNGCGKSPAAWSAQRFSQHARMPDLGWESVIVPGAVAAWADLSARYGRLPFDALLVPAIRYAHDGFLVSPVIARQWKIHADRLKEQPGFAAAFMPGGRAPKAGERFRFPALGRSLERIAATRGRDFYEGEIAAAVLADAVRHGAAVSADDLAGHRSEWLSPLAGRYRGLDVYQMPPPAQGLAVLSALGIMQHFDLGPGQDAVLRAHVQIEAMKMAFSDVYAHVADAAWMRDLPSALLDPEYLRSRAGHIDPARAAAHAPCPLPRHATVYLAAADRDGMVVSFIQSNYHGFGSGVVVPGTGVSLHNRGSGFTLEADHPNSVAGGKKPFHTTVPALLMREGRPWGALGVVGADMQPQGQVQIISALADLDSNPQAALDMPRWRIDQEGGIRLEAAAASQIGEGLMARGHRVVRMPPGNIDFGGAQCIIRVGDGYAGASDGSRDGSAVGT
ncbi:gamma-glutamyltransferase family protein [Pigmentiphaga sp. NML080357]|uniref:gamma-glutamyltransferase family protein n=1 Tax=Pigmentiphaga sp. NML080357 TaxID=2008675 RepID=UPI001E36365B|nr:gamma-glutamyltransferase family protein [Pigmentiphaga sp. NML080357]